MKEPSLIEKESIFKDVFGRKPGVLLGMAPQILLKVDWFFYLTDKIIISARPTDQSLPHIATYMNKTHNDNYLVYNLSGERYD